MGKTTIFFLPSLAIQNRGQGGRPVEGGRGAGDPVHGDGREVGQNEEEVEGNSFRSSPRSGTDCGGRSTTAGVSGIHPGYSCKEGRIVEDGLLVEFPCTPTRTRSVYSY
jgi:hypothetical protein